MRQPPLTQAPPDLLPPSVEISEAAFDYESYRQIMGVLARRLQEKVPSRSAAAPARLGHTLLPVVVSGCLLQIVVLAMKPKVLLAELSFA